MTNKVFINVLREELKLPSEISETNNQAVLSSIGFLMQSTNSDDEDDDENSSTNFKEGQVFSESGSFIESKPELVIESGTLSDFEKDHLLFIAELHNYSDASRKRVEDILKDTSELIKTTFTAVKDEVHILFRNQKNNNSICPSDVDKVIEKFSNPFKNMETEAQSFSAFKPSDSLILPKSFLLGQKEKIVEKDNTKIIKNVPVVPQFIPLRQVFKKFFEIPGEFDKIIEYQHRILRHSKIMLNIIQGPLWKKKVFNFDDKIAQCSAQTHQLCSIPFPSNGFVQIQKLIINNISVFEGFWPSFTRTVVKIEITVFEATGRITARCFN